MAVNGWEKVQNVYGNIQENKREELMLYNSQQQQHSNEHNTNGNWCFSPLSFIMNKSSLKFLLYTRSLYITLSLSIFLFRSLLYTFFFAIAISLSFHNILMKRWNTIFFSSIVLKRYKNIDFRVLNTYWITCFFDFIFYFLFQNKKKKKEIVEEGKSTLDINN